MLQEIVNGMLGAFVGGVFVAMISSPFAIWFGRYVYILGSGAEPEDRKVYDELRESLSTGGVAARVYSNGLKKLLDAADHFFNDAGVGTRTLFPNAFGLRTPAPLWTGPSFERCVFLAMAYTIMTIFSFWA